MTGTYRVQCHLSRSTTIALSCQQRPPLGHFYSLRGTNGRELLTFSGETARVAPGVNRSLHVAFPRGQTSGYRKSRRSTVWPVVAEFRQSCEPVTSRN